MSEKLTRLNTTLKPCNKTILLTGASGVVGQALLAQPHLHSVICLTHKKPVSSPTITAALSCDVSLPHLGLSYAHLKDIAKRIDCIVHSAAITNFNESDEVIQRTNVCGLENILELAAMAQVPLYYISTAFVRPRTDGSLEHTYTISKREGERLVQESGLPSVIIRPSIVIGDSKSGRIARFQGIYSIIGAFFKGVLPILPSLPQAYIDVIPQDLVAKSVFALIDNDCVEGEYWITSGKQSLTANQFVELVTGFSRCLGYTLKPPRLVSPDMIERLIRPVFMPALPKSVQKTFARLTQVSPYLSINEPFPTSLPEMETQFGIPLPSLETALIRSLEYWATENISTKRTA